MDRVGILVVSYGSRAAAIVDAFCRSENYKAEIYVADKQRNPFNVKKAKVHRVVPGLDIQKICKFAEKCADRIDFGIVGPEKPVIAGVRDLIEKETDIPVICPTKEYAIEGSKVAQRLLFQEVAPEVNPRFKVFDPKNHGSLAEVKKALWNWLDELENQVAVKPDSPVAGKGVGVWGDHFTTREQLFHHFQLNYEQGAVIVEEKVEGEESSFQAFCDGKHLVPMPETRDYKRAFDGDRGPNTGGMGSYKDAGDRLPFMTSVDRRKEIEIIEKIFQQLKGRGSNPGLRGIPFYVAFIHTAEGPKILENNSRPGDPEIINLVPVLDDDFINVCFKMIDGSLNRLAFKKKATVVTYKVPPTYGGYNEVFPNRVNSDEIGKAVDLTAAYGLSEEIRVYPGSMELRNGQTYALKSRAVCAVGIGDDIQTARELSLKGLNTIKGGALWHRTDIASKEHIKTSMQHMKQLRRLKA